MRPCKDCGTPTSGPYCPACRPAREKQRHNPIYDTTTWRRLRARVIAKWRREHGPTCPGFEREAHIAGNLTVDHVVALEDGGAPYELANLGVLCASCNSRKRFARCEVSGYERGDFVKAGGVG